MGERLLVTCPVILPPDPAVIESWTHRPMLVVINGHAKWRKVRRANGFAYAGDDHNDGCPSS